MRGFINKIDYNLIQLYGTDEKYYLLTEQQAQMLLTQTAYLSWGTRWENNGYTLDELQDIKDEIDYRLMTPESVVPFVTSIRLNNQTCKMEYEIDNTWI